MQLQALAVLLAAAQQVQPAHPLQIPQVVLLETVHLRISMDVVHSMVGQGPLIRLVLVELIQARIAEADQFRHQIELGEPPWLPIHNKAAVAPIRHHDTTPHIFLQNQN